MKVKIYDLQATVKKFAGLHYVEPRYVWKDLNALILGKDKFILSDGDAVHTIHDIGPDKFLELLLGAQPLVPADNEAIIIHDDSIRIPVEAFLKEEPVREEELTDFVRRGKDRIETNYKMLLASIKEIGLDPKDFPRGKE